MASFDPNIRPTNDPSYIGLSREPEKLRGNSALGDLFSGIGDVIGNATKATSEAIMRNARNDFTAGHDKILAESQGLQEARDTFPDPMNLDKGGPADSARYATGRAGGGFDGATESQRPVVERNPVVEDLRKRVDTLTQAYKQGTFNETYYATQVDALTRQVRAKYPGFREDVDQMVKEVTGIVPANYLRKQLLTDMGTFQSELEKQKNDDQKWARDNMPYLIQALGPEGAKNVLDNVGSGKVNMNALRTIVGNKQMEELQVQQTTRRLEMESKQGTADKTNFTAAATGEMATRFNNIFTQATRGTNFYDLMTKAQNGATLNDAERQEIELHMGKFRTALENNVNDFLNTPRFQIPGKPGKQSYAQIVGFEEAQRLREQGMREFEVLSKALNDKDYGTLTAKARNIEARQNTAVADILGDPDLATFAAARKLYGDNYIASVMSNPEMAGSLVQKLRSLHAQKIINKEYTGLDDQISAIIQLGKRDPNARYQGKDIKQVFTDITRGITDPTNTIEGKIRFAEHAFDPSNSNVLFNRFANDGKTKQEIYRMLVTPQVSAEMKKLKEAGGAGAIAAENYDRWASLNFARLFKTDIDTIAKGGNNAEGYSVIWDPKQKQFLFQPSQALMESGKGRDFKQGQAAGTGNPDFRRLAGNDVYDAITRLNGVIGSYATAAEVGGRDVSREVLNVMVASGFDPNGPKQPGPGVLKGMWDSVRGIFTSDGKKGEESDNSLQGKSMENYRKQQQSTPGGPQKRSDALSLDDNVQLASYDGSSGDHPIIQAILPGESKGNYNVMNGGRLANLTNMTVQEVMNAQRQAKATAGGGSGAAGKYQIVESTMRWLIDRGYIKPTDTFDEATQDKAGHALLFDKAGYSDYTKGKISYGQFMDKLENEWETIKVHPESRRRVFKAVDKLDRESTT